MLFPTSYMLRPKMVIIKPDDNLFSRNVYLICNSVVLSSKYS